jgi:transposase
MRIYMTARTWEGEAPQAVAKDLRLLQDNDASVSNPHVLVPVWEAFMKVFRDAVCERGQIMLMPPCVDDFVTKKHEVRLFDEIVARMDASVLLCAYSGGGAPAYDPRMLLRVALYGLWRGVRTSRDLARQLEENLAFRWLAQMQCPDYSTISRFLKRHREALAPLFVQTIGLAKDLGLVSMAHVAVDGTAIEANVSGKSTYSKERIEKTLAYVNEQIGEWLKQDEADDAQFGDRRGDELPDELSTLKARKERLEKLEAEREQTGRNSIAATDPQSRVMRIRGAMRPAYNAQAAVDSANQVIVAADVICQQTDNAALPAVMDQVVANTGESPQMALADAGYSGPALVACAQTHTSTEFYVALQGRKTDPRREHFTYDAERDVMLDENGREHFFWTEREKHGTKYRIYRARGKPKSEIWEPQNGDFNRKMRDKLSTPEGKATYNLRRQTVEPVFGFMKTRMHMRRFLRRGHAGVRAEFLLACIAHNLGKIMRYGWAAPA